MTKQKRFRIIPINKEDINYFQKFYHNHYVTDKLLEERTGDIITRTIILKSKNKNGQYTPYGCVRDCGDHYIIARYSSYDKVEKNTLKITNYVEDK